VISSGTVAVASWVNMTFASLLIQQIADISYSKLNTHNTNSVRVDRRNSPYKTWAYRLATGMM
jgi:hypothetical protein